MSHMTLTSYDTLDNDEIADIRRERKAHKATAIGTRSYYYMDDAGYVFVSYWTKIARYNPKTKSLDFVCHDLYAYSRTTVKHLNVFVKAIGYPASIGINDIRKIAASGWHEITIKSTLDKQ